MKKRRVENVINQFLMMHSKRLLLSSFYIEKPVSDSIDPESEGYFRIIEKENIVKLMSLITEKVFKDKFDNKIGAHKLEERKRKREKIPQPHLKIYDV